VNNAEITRSPKYVFWRYSVKKRDKFACKVCGRKKKLQAHHIYPRYKFPEKTYDLGNGITLCRICHILIRGEELRFVNMFLKLIENGVNSVKLLKVEDNTELSQESNLLESLTTRSRDLTEESFIEKRVVCVNCGKAKWIPNYRAQKSKNFFCTFKCQSLFKKGKDAGRESWNWKGITNKCLYCGKDSHAPSRYSRRKKFCDNICQNAYQRKRDGWSRKYDKCISCQTTKIRHKGNGLCVICHLKKRKVNGLFNKVSNTSTSALHSKE